MNPVRTLIVGFLSIVFVGWCLWVLMATQPCERVYRMAAPVRELIHGVRLGAANWIDQADKDSMLVTQYQMDASTQRFLQRQFYNDLTCIKGKQ